jgi:hypothetical protein
MKENFKILTWMCVKGYDIEIRRRRRRRRRRGECVCVKPVD